MLTINNLTFSFDSKMILDDVSIDFSPEKLTIILGPNGAGKSTLFRLIAGILSPQNGEIIYENENLANLSLKERSRLTGYLSQQHKAVFPFSVFDVVLTGCAGSAGFTPKKTDYDKTQFALQETGIFHLKDNLYTELSGGEQQLVMIARLFAQDPDVILLDEPTSHLDFENQARIFKILIQLVNKGKTVIAVVHDPNLAALYADRIIFLKDKKVIVETDDKKIWNREFLQKFYKTKIEVLPFAGRLIVLPHIE